LGILGLHLAAKKAAPRVWLGMLIFSAESLFFGMDEHVIRVVRVPASRHRFRHDGYVADRSLGMVGGPARGWPWRRRGNRLTKP